VVWRGRSAGGAVRADVDERALEGIVRFEHSSTIS
jgi:hypothetical protein